MNDVLDAAIFLVLASAAVGALALPVHRPAAGSADDVATVVATSTAGVNYTLAPAGEAGDRAGSARAGEARTARGTLAQLLAAAAVRDVSIGGEELTAADDGYERAVVAATANATRDGRPVAVDAVWEPYPDAPVRGHVHAGPRPPSTADVWSVSLRVGSGFPAARARAGRAAETDGYAGVARVVTRALVAGLFPPDATAVALGDDYPVDALARHRYRRFAGLVGASVAGPVEKRIPRRANERLARALAPQIEADLRTSYDSPGAAAGAVSVATVRVTVRTWSG